MGFVSTLKKFLFSALLAVVVGASIGAAQFLSGRALERICAPAGVR